MHTPAIVFLYEGLTVHAAEQGDHFRGELLNSDGEVKDIFVYRRDDFPGAVIGAFGLTDVSFAPRLALRLWLHTAD